MKVILLIALTLHFNSTCSQNLLSCPDNDCWCCPFKDGQCFNDEGMPPCCCEVRGTRPCYEGTEVLGCCETGKYTEVFHLLHFVLLVQHPCGYQKGIRNPKNLPFNLWKCFEICSKRGCVWNALVKPLWSNYFFCVGAIGKLNWDKVCKKCPLSALRHKIKFFDWFYVFKNKQVWYAGSLGICDHKYLVFCVNLYVSVVEFLWFSYCNWVFGKFKMSYFM